MRYVNCASALPESRVPTAVDCHVWLLDVAERAKHEPNGHVGRCIVDCYRRARHRNASLCACADIDVVVSRAVVADVLEALGQRIEQLGIEVSGNGIGVVTPVEGVDSIKFAALALGNEVFAVAIGVLV